MLACAADAPAAAGAPASLELSAAWGGSSRPGRMTEIRVRLSAPLAGRARLQIEAGEASIESEVILPAQQPVELRIPVPAAESIEVHASLADGSHLDRELSLRLAEMPLVAVGVASLGGLPDDLGKTEVDAAAYPAETSAYEAVDVIAIDAPTLSRLDHDQLQALVGYVGGCGLTIAVDLPADAVALLRSEAGCEGRALLASGTATAEAVGRLLATAPRGPASRAELRTLLPPVTGPWPFVMSGLAIYLAGALLLVVFARRSAVVLAYALLGTVLVPIAEHAARAPQRLSVWSESDSQDRRGRYSALGETTGTAHVARAMGLPGVLGDAEPCESDNTESHARWQWDSNRSRYSSVTFDQTLFGIAAVCWHGGFPLTRAAALEQRAEDALQVTNRGPAAWPAGVLIRDGRLYGLPAIPAGKASLLQRAGADPAASSGPQPTTVSGTQPASSAATNLALSRTAEHEGSLLWPLELPPLGVAPDSARAYLLVRAPLGARP